MVRQSPYDTLTGFNAFDILALANELHFRKFQFLGHHEVHAALSLVHVGMHRGDSDMICEGFHHRTLYIVLATQAGEFMEDEGMVRDDEITVEADGLVDRFFGHVRHNKAPETSASVNPYLQAGIVEVFLQRQRRELLKGMNHFYNFHAIHVLDYKS